MGFTGGEREELLRAHDCRNADPAEVSNLRDGGVAPKGKIPQEFSLELFSHVPR
jgi:hypothetical protein